MCGLILVSPFLANVNDLAPLLEHHGPYQLRVYITAGERDRYCRLVAQQLTELLPKYGIVCRLEESTDLEHAFPQDFESRLPDALKFVMPQDLS